MHVRQTLTAVLVAAAAVTALPAAASAQPNTGGGGSESSYCQTLLDRTKRYNDLAHDPRQSQAVRDFYASRAAITLLHAQQAGCGWATRQAVSAPTVEASRATGTAPARTTRTSRRRVSFRTLNRSLRMRATSPTTTTGGPRVPSGVAYIKAAPTGNPGQDDYCRKVADLIADAENQGDTASANGNQQSADEWYELADYMTDTATQNGCRFVLGIKATRLQEFRAQGVVATRA